MRRRRRRGPRPHVDLDCPGPYGLQLRGGSTLDLDGHRITGPGTRDGVALAIYGPGDVTVSGGTLEDWRIGVLRTGDRLYQSEAPVLVLDHVTVRGNAYGIFFGGYIRPAPSVEITSSELVDNQVAIEGSWPAPLTVTSSRFVGNELGANLLYSGPYPQDAGRATFTDTVFSGNRASLICDGVVCDLVDSTLQGGQDGVFALDTTVTLWNTVVEGHSSVGLLSQDGGRFEVGSSTFRDNGAGLVVSERSSASVLDSAFVGNGTGVRAWRSVGLEVVGNVLEGNDEALSTQDANATVVENLFVDNEVAGVGDAGEVMLVGNVFRRNGDGLLSTLPGVALEANTAVGNERWGHPRARCRRPRRQPGVG